jgi:hypothetical protein
MLDKVVVCILEGGGRIANGSGKFKNEPEQTPGKKFTSEKLQSLSNVWTKPGP